MSSSISKDILSHIDVTVKVLWDKVPVVEQAVKLALERINKGGKLVLFGNGGSAADSQHIAAEMVGRFLKERHALPAISLTTDTSVLTSLSNDYCFEKVFQRQVESLVSKNDLVMAISTSGNSKNVINGAIAAKKIGAKIVALTGEGGGNLSRYADLLLDVPSKDTPRIQEMHILIGHVICNQVEISLFSGVKKSRKKK